MRIEGSFRGKKKDVVRLWQAATGQDVVPPLAHPNNVESLRFSADGRTLVTVDLNGRINLWDVTTGKLVRRIKLSRQRQERALSPKVAISPDGTTLATGGHQNKIARLWNVATGQARGDLVHPNVVTAVVFSPDNRMLLTGCADGAARIWDLATGKVISASMKHREEIDTVAFSPDGRLAATCSADRTARLWEVNTGRPVGPPLYHATYLTAVAFSPDGKALLTGGEHIVRRWPVPIPLKWPKERITLWAQVVTGMELDRFGEINRLDAATWQQRRQRLEEWDNPPR
jgi:WD40 repeat protein